MSDDIDFDWYAAIAKPGRTFDAVAELTTAGVTAFAPREMRSRRPTRKQKARECYAVPAVGSYLFFGVANSATSAIPWSTLISAKYISDVLRVEDQLARIDHGSIRRMRDLDGLWSTDVRYGGLATNALRVGDEVSIGSNAWGTVKITALAKGTVTVSFQAFGSERQTTVKKSVIEAALQAA